MQGLIGIDFEYVAENAVQGQRPDVQKDYCEIFSIGAVKLDSNGQVVERLDLTVAPTLIASIPDWLSQLTGVSNESRKGGISFEQALQTLERFSSSGSFELWCFKGDWHVLRGNCERRKVPLPAIFARPFQRAFSLATERCGLTADDFTGAGHKEMCSGNLAPFFGLKVASSKREHDACFDAESLVLGVALMLQTLQVAHECGSAAGYPSPLPVVRSICRALLLQRVSSSSSSLPKLTFFNHLSASTSPVSFNGASIAFLGLGAMGCQMSRRLNELTAFQVRSWNRSQHAQRTHDSVADAVRDARFVFCMLADDTASRDVITPSLAHMTPGSMLVSMSTLSLDTVRWIEEQSAKVRVRFVNCPVFGRPDAAGRGELFLVAGGSTSDIDELEQSGIMKVLGQRTLRFSSATHSALAKLCGNFMIANAFETLSSVIVVCEKYGMQGKDMLHMLLSTLFGSPINSRYGSLLLKREFTPPGFTLKLGLKDINLFISACDKALVSAPVAHVIKEHVLSTMALNPNFEELDWSAILLAIEASAGVTKK